ncbi:MAG: L-histidine N(alpha)-methyltransferase [Planctomycetota bacterium]|nr:L-histidine N(alpha)-methyltransferase [Planctomycetota bacterium]
MRTSADPTRRRAATTVRRDKAAGEFLADVLEGLSKPQKTLPCKYFYDARGSELFDEICEQPEYYPTRTETAILDEHLDAIGETMPPGAVLVEYGSGSSTKTRLLLDRLEDLAAYVPVDICDSHLLRSAWQLKAAYPRLTVRPVCADFTKPFRVPRLDGRPRVLFFPGSTIGNFGPADAIALLTGMAEIARPGGGLLIGVDLLKSPHVLEPAYDDAAGVTAAFNLNLLERINREFDGSFDLDAFEHRAIFNADDSRVEMHLVSQTEQVAEVDGTQFRFATGETIHTENSYKYSREAFAGLANRAGWRVETVWTDPLDYFGVHYLVAE